MSSKMQAKKAKAVSVPKGTEDEDEIVEIEEIPSRKTSRKNPKKKDGTENSSSEATTPNKKNKKKQNKKEKNLELIEIMEADIPENDITQNSKKPSAPVPKRKKSINKAVANDKEKPISIKSVNAFRTNGKSPFKKGKKYHKKIASITLDESENENENESEIKVTTEVKISPIKRQSTSKTPKKKVSNKIKEFTNAQEKKNKKNEKKNNKKNDEVIQCELSSESENEKKKEVNSRPNKKKNDKNQKIEKNHKISPDNNYNSGYFSSRKASQKKKIINEIKEVKSRSTIKLSLKDDSMKSKVDNLLGRKRKSDSLNKKADKSESNIGNQNLKNPSQIKAGKQKAKTPLKYNQKKNHKNNNITVIKMDIDEKDGEKTYYTPELAVLDQLITEYGFERVLESLCKSKLNQKKKLDSCLQGLKNSCSNDRLTFLLIKMLFSYFDEKFDVPNKKRSISAIKHNNIKNEVELSNKSKIIKNIYEYSVMDHYDDGNPIEVNEEKINELKDKIKNKNNCVDNNNNNNSKEDKNDKIDEKKGEKKSVKKMMSIGSHYNKADDGNVYKYQVASLDGKGNAIFKCYDDKCNGTGIYNLETRKFSVTKIHNLPHAEHDYIKSSDKDGDNVFKDIIDKEKNDAQVFKENGERIVKIY